MRLEKSCSDIVDEELPVSLRPFEPFSVFSAREPVETNAVASYQIEFSSEIGQGRLGLDASDDTTNVEELGRAAEERFRICVESQPFVTEEPAEIEKIASAAAKIENLQWRRTIEPKVLRALNVHADPVHCVFVGVDFARVGPVGITLA